MVGAIAAGRGTELLDYVGDRLVAYPEQLRGDRPLERLVEQPAEVGLRVVRAHEVVVVVAARPREPLISEEALNQHQRRGEAQRLLPGARRVLVDRERLEV